MLKLITVATFVTVIDHAAFAAPNVPDSVRLKSSTSALQSSTRITEQSSSDSKTNSVNKAKISDSGSADNPNDIPIPPSATDPIVLKEPAALPTVDMKGAPKNRSIPTSAAAELLEQSAQDKLKGLIGGDWKDYLNPGEEEKALLKGLFKQEEKLAAGSSRRLEEQLSEDGLLLEAAAMIPGEADLQTAVEQQEQQSQEQTQQNDRMIALEQYRLAAQEQQQQQHRLAEQAQLPYYE
ncbi:unnamed protein product [Gongylonema pulchrum]|uniref:Secreted protein n=1 Tax=Gongylonema pulchrum TaxID=637853 RepID=A0A183D278_9BILA|nr:unnamed protein product [Gongylonema pulchrum]